MGMIVNTNKTKIVIIESKKDIYAIFIYDNKNIEEVTSYKYLGMLFITRSIGTITLRK